MLRQQMSGLLQAATDAVVEAQHREEKAFLNGEIPKNQWRPEKYAEAVLHVVGRANEHANLHVDLPTLGDVQDAAVEHGYTVDAVECCPWQGTLIAFSRPKAADEKFIDVPVAGDRVDMEVVERNYCPDEVAPDDVQAEAFGRACQRVIWAMGAPRKVTAPKLSSKTIAWCPRLNAPATFCHHDGCTHYLIETKTGKPR